MRPLEYLRGKAFWLMDGLRGGKVCEYLGLIKRIEGARDYSERELSEYRREKIKRLLEHCVNTVPAYSGLDPEELDKWPVVNKMTLRDGGDSYLSTAFDKAGLVPMTTSGSTGTPFTCLQNQDKKRHVNAEVLFYNGMTGYVIGRKIIYFRSVVSEVKKSRLQQFLQNIDLVDCSDLSDDGIRAKIARIRKLSKGGGAMILSYASTLDAFCRYFERHGVEEARGCNIYGVVSGSEMLKDSTRKVIGRAFNCKVVSRYSNEENGFIGQDGVEDNVFMHNRANYYIEILKFDSDRPAGLGEVGRIVITDLYNYAMPMVRYDTGDVGTWQEIRVDGRSRMAIGKFGGRRVDMIYDTSGGIISPHSITNYMWRYSDVIRQFQFIQLDRSAYRLKVNPSGMFDEQELIAGLRAVVGRDACVTIEYCDEIPVLASGKRKYIVNLMNTVQK